jgi:S-DNA-T family DNA segregation ATPase FtsK/SpoIIIE
MSDRPVPGAVAPRTARCWTVTSDDGAVDVEVIAHDDDQVGAVRPMLERALGVPVDGLWAGSTRLPDDLPLTAPELTHGAVLGLGRPAPRSGIENRSSALELHVVGGPDAGLTVPLGRGRHVLGRGAEATVRLDDPDVSRRHVAVQIGGGDLTVADLDSTNGSRLDTENLGRVPRSWPAAAILRLGASAVTIIGPGGPGAAIEGARGGRSQVRPTPRMRTPAPAAEITFPSEPIAGPRRRLAWLPVALPALAGVLMSWVLQTPTFLFFALLSPVVAVATWGSDRWSGRRASRSQRAAYAVELHAADTLLSSAVREAVRAAEDAHPDLATLTTAARRRSRLLWSRRLGDVDALSIRVGSGPGGTGVTRVGPGGSRIPESAAHTPAVVDLRSGGGLGIVGPRAPAVGVLTSVMAQLAALHSPGDVDFVLLVDADRLDEWAWMRWLPHLDTDGVHVRPTGRAGAAAQRHDEALTTWLTDLAARRRSVTGTCSTPSGAPVQPNWVVVLVDRPLDARLAAALRDARDVGVLVIAAAAKPGDLPVDVETVLRLTGETGGAAVLSREGLPDQGGILVDRLASPVAARFGRDLAGLAPTATTPAFPEKVRLLDLPFSGIQVDARGRVAGTWSRDRDRLVATLGSSAEGPVEIDLCRQGPHALVAGTTGSGKSELLQTLIVSLALRHPPDRCSFLLVDYKGGAAFAEAAALPHTVGLVTDLDGHTTARALRSLTAELTRREAVLAAQQVSDIGALPDDVSLARLVIIVDEFAALAEEMPAFVPGLVSIAQRGRSLGVHLVLATQRPGGVVSPEIRANCTLRICLRTTDDADSRDVLGSPRAAHLPVDRPGRAYLRVGSGEPVALQVARVAAPPVSRAAVDPEVRPWTWPFACGLPDGPPDGEGDTDLARLTRFLNRHAKVRGTPAPHRPWRPALPDEVVPGPQVEPGDRAGGTRLWLGLVDLPDRQSREALELDLADGGAWLAVGGPRSGRSTLLRTVLTEAVGRLAPDGLHVHVIDSTGGPLAAEAAGVPHTGTSIGGPEVLRTVRLVDRLLSEVADRRAAPSAAGRPLILLLIDGVEAVTALLDEADPPHGSSGLLRLMRDGAAVGLTCVLTADRAVPGGRLAAAVRQRLILPLPDRADYAVAGIPARAVPARRPPGRALLGEDAVECQLSLPGPLRARTESGPPAPGGADRLRITDFDPDPVLELPTAGSAAAGYVAALSLPIGPGGDEGEPAVVDLLLTGGLLVTGPPGSGRSSALDAFARHLAGSGTPVLRIGRPQTDLSGSADPTLDSPEPDPDALDPLWLDPDDEAGAASWLAGRAGRACAVVADDVGTPPESAALRALPALGRGTGVVLLASSTAGQFTGHYQGPVAHLRRARSGLLLCPGPGEADLLGLRLPRTPLPVRPGSGWLATLGRLERVQVARRRRPVRERADR